MNKAFLFNLRYTLRRLRNNPGTACVAIFVMALGIAVATPLYTLIQTFGYASLPVPDQDRIMRVVSVNEETNQPRRGGFDNYQFELIQDSLRNDATIAAFSGYRAILSDGEVAEDFWASRVSPSFFPIFGDSALLGRTLMPDDAVPDAEPVVILGFNAWQNYYGGNPNVIGQTSRINGEPHTVVGVMPEGFSYPDFRQLWTARTNSDSSSSGGSKNLSIVVKFSPTMSMEESDARIGGLFTNLRSDYPETYRTDSARYVPFTEYLSVTSNLAPVGYLMSSVAFFTLLLVSFNLGNLLLIRAGERAQELGIRNALGSTKTELIKEVLRESFVICAIGLLSGLVVAKLVLDIAAFEFDYLLGTEGAALLPPWVEFDVTLTVFLFALSVTTIIWIVTGTFSTWWLARQDIGELVQKGTKNLAGSSSKRMTHLLVGTEVLVSTALLIVCGSAFIAALNGTRADFGAEADNFFVGQIELTASDYQSNASRLNYISDLRTALIEQENFSNVTFTTAVPGQYGEGVTYALDDREFDADSLPTQGQVWVADDFFEVFGVPLKEGRWFDSSDVFDSLAVTIVDENFAESTWPGESPLGKRIEVSRDQQSEWLQIVGVTSHIIHDEPMSPQTNLTTIYRPLAQSPLDSLRVAVRLTNDQSLDTNTVSTRLRQAASNVNRDIPILNIHPLKRIMQSAMNGNDLLGELLLGIALVVFSLAIIALFAIVSRSIISRANEIGVRRALGSSDMKAISIFLKQGVTYVAIALPMGGGIGILASSAFLSSANQFGDIIFDVSVSVALVITMMVLLASYIPSRKVVALEPGEALHYE